MNKIRNPEKIVTINVTEQILPKKTDDHTRILFIEHMDKYHINDDVKDYLIDLNPVETRKTIYWKW